MSVSATITFTSPDGSTVVTVEPTRLSLPHAEPGTAALLTGEIPHGWDGFEDENAAANAVQFNSGAVLTLRGETEFQGKLKVVYREQMRDGKRVIPFECADHWADLNDTLAGYDGDSRFTIVTDEDEESDITLVPGAADDERAYPFWPTLGQSQCWLPISGDGAAPSLQLAANISDSAASIVLSGDASDWPPRGYGLIDAEGFYYDGKHKTSSSPEQWTLRNCQRGSLDTSAAAHSLGDYCYCKIPKRISASGQVEVEGNTGAAWETIGHGNYIVDQEDACFSFKGNPLASPYNAGSGYTAVRATYTLFDETDASAVTFEDVAQALFEYDGDGGPDIDAGDIDIDVPYLPVTRLVLKQSNNTWAVLRQLLAEYVVDRANAADDIACWYDSVNGKYCIEQITQASSPDGVLRGCNRVHEELNTSGLYSGYLVGFQGHAPSWFSPTRCWLPDVGDSLGGQSVTAQMWMVCDRDMTAGWNEDTGGLGNDGRADLLCDGNENTGVGAKFASVPTGTISAAYCWTPSSNTRVTDHIRVVLDLRRFIKSTQCIVEVVGYTSCGAGTPPSSGHLHLADSLRIVLGEDRGQQGPGPVDRVGLLGGRLVGSSWALTRGAG